MRPLVNILQCLSIIIIVPGLTTCRSAPVVRTPTPLLSTPPSTPTSVNSQEPTPPSNQATAIILVGNAPGRMTVGDGFVWVVTHTDHSVIKIDPNTNQVVGEPIPAGPEPEAIAFGDGALWAATISSDRYATEDSMAQIDSNLNQLVATFMIPRWPENLAVSPGILWVTNFTSNSVTRIDTQTNQIIGEPIVTGAAPISIAIGDGSAWVANHDEGTVTRIDLATQLVVANILVPYEPHRVAYGEGAVWVGNWHDKSVSRIDPQTNQVVGEAIPIGVHAGSLAVGHGSVWVTSDYRSNGEAQDVVLVRIDPETNRAIETIAVGGHPIDVAITDDAIWVSVQKPDGILRLTP